MNAVQVWLLTLSSGEAGTAIVGIALGVGVGGNGGGTITGTLSRIPDVEPVDPETQQWLP